MSPQHLTDMDIDRVSLVDKGANGRVFAILKRQEAAMTNPVAKSDPQGTTDILGLVRKLAERVGLVHVDKAQSFAAVIAGQELTDALDDSWWTLWDVLWGAMYATDANGADLDMAAKQALVAQDLDEFKAYLLNAMSTTLGKRARPGDGDLAKRGVAAAIAKVGAKVSAARLERLKTAADALNEVLAEVDADTEKRADAQEADMTPEELTAAIEKANKPLLDRIAELEKAAKPATPAAAPVEKKDETEDELTLEGVAKAFIDFRTEVDGKLDQILKARGERTSADGQEGDKVAKRGTFAGIL
jgi:hypothetical protein